MTPLTLQTGDIILTHCTSNWFSRLSVRICPPATHEAVVRDSATIVGFLMSDLKGQLHKLTLAEFAADNADDVPPTEWVIYRRRTPLSAWQIETIQTALDEELSWARYSYAELALQAADGILAKLLRRPRVGLDVLVFRRLGKLWDHGVICSKSANRPLIKVGLLPDLLEYASPSDTFDYVQKNIDKWMIVGNSKGWTWS